MSIFFTFLLLIVKPQDVFGQQQQKEQIKDIRFLQQNLKNHDNLGDLATFNLEPFTPNISYRQDVCHRYDAFRNGTMELRNALEGLNLRPVIKLNEYFNYDIETGIDPNNPGLVGTLLDELAKRAGFTWRDSFAVFETPTSAMVNNVTWTFTDLLVWNVETYDVAINYWDQSLERMELGVAYVEPWFDGSVILIDQVDPPKDANATNLFNWLRPFQVGVWLLTVFTVLISGCVHQLIEYLNDERNERSFWEWFCDSNYLSWLNVTTNFEYEPTSLSGRIFGISMAIWALVMSATYTANLASLLVEQKVAPTIVDSIDKAIVLGIPICTYANTNAEFIIKRRYADAIRIPKPSELEAYKALQRGECGLVAGYKDNWLGFQKDRRYNPECNLEWVGRTIEIIKSGFATNADSGHLCSSLIRDVLNLHMIEMIRDGVLEDAWEIHRATAAGVDTINCLAEDNMSSTTEDDDVSARLLREHQEHDSLTLGSRRDHDNPTGVVFGNRKLKGGGGANSAAANGGKKEDGEGERLTIQQMAGTFVLHFMMMSIAVMVGLIDRFLRTPPRDEEKAAAAAAVKRCGEDSLPEECAPADDTECSTFGALPPAGRSDYIDTNNKSLMVLESRICNLEKSISTTQQELKNSHEKMQSQMNVILSLVQEMHQNKVGSVEAAGLSS